MSDTGSHGFSLLFWHLCGCYLTHKPPSKHCFRQSESPHGNSTPLLHPWISLSHGCSDLNMGNWVRLVRLSSWFVSCRIHMNARTLHSSKMMSVINVNVVADRCRVYQTKAQRSKSVVWYQIQHREKSLIHNMTNSIIIKAETTIQLIEKSTYLQHFFFL